ncbi:hypothetical protein [Cognatishimia sp. F0-27]|uniref:hypothetical protein n=1 Tax=Cognatishimia sp. F0-27 TaxID=2816855 RepID=UPI001D0C26F3|nr:hypothetical protein [Cognatishimia sp. F0-27]MCC1491814.1 hypothetical protein [Cognatishimia sp. F0-27]
MRIDLLFITAALLCGQATTALAQTGLTDPGRAPVAGSATVPPVESLPLEEIDVASAGLLPSRMTGLPVSLWQGSDPEALRDLILAVQPAVPALRDLMRVLMLAEADAPAGGEAADRHLAARLDRLMGAGFIEEAQALLQIAGHRSTELFRPWADVNLLLGRSDAPCAALERAPALSRDTALQVFCIARSGDWPRAALIVQTAATLGTIPARRIDLLERFLDGELHEIRAPILPPVRPTPLEFRLFEALGEPLPTAPLPLKFSVLDLTGDNGWRAQIEAAERLARAGALPPNRLLGLYTLRKPAASGGVWDRVRALQALERALERGTPGTVEQALIRLWPQMASQGLLVPVAELFATDLVALDLDGRAGRIARQAAFLSTAYESLAISLDGTDPEVRFLTAIARGAAPEAPGTLPHAAAVARAFSGATPPDSLVAKRADGRLGEVILRAMALVSSGAEGNGQDLTDGLATLRAVGLEDAARRTALQLMVLDAERARR